MPALLMRISSDPKRSPTSLAAAVIDSPWSRSMMIGVKEISMLDSCSFLVAPSGFSWEWAPKGDYIGRCWPAVAQLRILSPGLHRLSKSRA